MRIPTPSPITRTPVIIMSVQCKKRDRCNTKIWTEAKGMDTYSKAVGMPNHGEFHSNQNNAVEVFSWPRSFHEQCPGLWLVDKINSLLPMSELQGCVCTVLLSSILLLCPYSTEHIVLM